MYEEMIKKIFKRYLDMQGYIFIDEDLRELVEIYLDCQEWDDDKLITGITEIEMIDWIKHSSEVDRIASLRERFICVNKVILTYMEMTKTKKIKKFNHDVEIDIATQLY